LVAQLEGGGWSPLDWSADDQKLLILEEISINETYLWVVDGKSGEKARITRKDGSEKVAYGEAAFSKDGKGVYLITDAGSEFRRLGYLDLKTDELKFLSPSIPGDVDDFDLSADRSKIAFITNEDGIGKLYLLDPSSGKVRGFANLPVGVIGRVKWHRNGRYLGFTLSSARLQGDAFSLDVQTGKLERWTNSETGGLNIENFVEPELIHWKSFDGKLISGFLYRPAGRFTGKRPVMIDIHGGPEAQFRPGFLGNRNYYLNELGVAMIFPNIRGSSGFGKTFLKLDDGFLRADTYKDIGALLDRSATGPRCQPRTCDRGELWRPYVPGRVILI
jgi:dipeptidyl aminopeptidase/acylaminoacyl peptidase